MTLVTGGRSRERVLVYGMEFVGKSYCAIDIAARIAPHRLFVIDNDNAWDRMLEEPALDGTEIQVQAEWRWDDKADGKGGWVFDDSWAVEGGNVWVYHVAGWEQNAAAIASVLEEAGPHDWCLIDSGSALWDDVQRWFTEKVFGQSKADYFLQTRLAIAAAAKDQSSLGALDGWVDWPIINAEYQERVMRFLVTPPCHLLVTCEEAQVSSGQVKGKDLEDKETRSLYGSIGYKPRGQKRIGHNMQTVLRLERKANGDFCARTIKDRGGRERWTGESVTGRGFADWYLEETAGWQDEASTSSPPSSPASSPKPKGSAVPAPKPKMAAKA